jgi:hypothetical protein
MKGEHMEDLTARAELVDPSEVDAGSVTATIPRREIEEALAVDDGPADLILDVASTDDGGGRRITVEWDRADLERLLGQAEDDAIVFAFDREPLALAFDEPDVEGHGLREKALVLTVAAATAAGAAGAAKAVPDMGEGVMSSQGPAAYSAIESARSGETGAGLPAGYGQVVQEFRATEAAGADAPLAGYAGVEATRAAETVSSDAARGSSAIEAARAAEAAPDPVLAGYAGIDTVGAEVAAELGTGQAAAEYTAVEAARADAPGQTTGGDTGGGTFAIETPSPSQTAALAGAAALAITGAAFMARSRRRLTPSS